MKEQVVFYTGNINNPPIIFVHGFPYDHNMWNAQVENLKGEFYCITYDVRGLGKSSSEDNQFTIEDLSEDLIELASSLKSKPVVCGLSMGGYITLRALEKSEDTFRAAILCDTKPEADVNENKIKRAQGIKSINTDGLGQFVEGFIKSCFSERFIKENPEQYKTIVDHSKEFNSVGVKACLLAMAGRTDTTNALASFGLPVLVLCGEEDKLAPPEVMKKMSDAITTSEFYIISDAGHMAPIENPDRVNYLIKAFLHKVT